MISAYRIGGYVYLIGTDIPADPTPPKIIPMSSTRLTPEEAMEVAQQIIEAVADEIAKPSGHMMGAE